MVVQNPAEFSNPSTSPWHLYVLVAALVVGWVKPAWRWFRRDTGAGWPLAEGLIDSFKVSQTSGFSAFLFHAGRLSLYAAVLEYSYLIAGDQHRGRYKREFGTERAAREFGRGLEGKAVTVHFNPNKAWVSTLLESDIETLLQTRPPLSKEESFTWPSPNSVPRRVKRILWIFVLLSAVGLVASISVHLGAVMGRKVVPEALFAFLHGGIFVVWLPAVLIAQRRGRGLNRYEAWDAVLEGSPEWMRSMMYSFFAYGIINFSVFLYERQVAGGGSNIDAVEVAGFSGHWMLFYSAALTILYSAAHETDG